MLRDTYHRLRQLTAARNRVEACGDWARTRVSHHTRTWKGYGREVELRGPKLPTGAFWMVVQRDPASSREQVIDHSLTRPDAVRVAEEYMSELAQREGARLAATEDRLATAD